MQNRFKLNDYERIVFYVQAANLLTLGENKYICTALRRVFAQRKNINVKLNEIESLFPELMRHLPIKETGIMPRLKVLHFCVGEILEKI